MKVYEINFKVNLSYGDEDFLQDGMSEATLLQFVSWGIVLPIITVFGIIGNILTMIVLWRKEMQSTTILFLRALVVTDTAIIIVAFIALTPFIIAIYQCPDECPDTSMGYFKDVIYPNIYTPINFLAMAIQQINVWITVFVSTERYIAICHPFRAVGFCTKRAARITLIVVTIVSIVYNLPRCIATVAKRGCPEDSSPINSNVGNTTNTTYAIVLANVTGKEQSQTAVNDNCFTLVSTEFGKGFFYQTVYFMWMYTILIYVIPLTVLFVLNFLIIRELMKMQERRHGTNIQDDNEANLSLVLVLIVVVFIVCQTPGLIAQFEMFPVLVLKKWLAISNTLFVMNSSVNFLIYTAVGKRFRKILLKIFRRLFTKPVLSDMSRSSRLSNGYELSPVNEETQVENLEKVRLKS